MLLCISCQCCILECIGKCEAHKYIIFMRKYIQDVRVRNDNKMAIKSMRQNGYVLQWNYMNFILYYTLYLFQMKTERIVMLLLRIAVMLNSNKWHIEPNLLNLCILNLLRYIKHIKVKTKEWTRLPINNFLEIVLKISILFPFCSIQHIEYLKQAS